MAVGLHTAPEALRFNTYSLCTAPSGPHTIDETLIGFVSCRTVYATQNTVHRTLHPHQVHLVAATRRTAAYLCMRLHALSPLRATRAILHSSTRFASRQKFANHQSNQSLRLMRPVTRCTVPCMCQLASTTQQHQARSQARACRCMALLVCTAACMYRMVLCALFIYLITGLLDNIRHCCPVYGPSQTQ